jgi:hypothetical protein
MPTRGNLSIGLDVVQSPFIVGIDGFLATEQIDLRLRLLPRQGSDESALGASSSIQTHTRSTRHQ